VVFETNRDSGDNEIYIMNRDGSGQTRLTNISGPEFKIEKDVYRYLSLEAVVERRRAPGGTASSNVRRRLKEMGG